MKKITPRIIAFFVISAMILPTGIAYAMGGMGGGFGGGSSGGKTDFSVLIPGRNEDAFS